MQDERLIAHTLKEPGEVRLLDARVNVRVAVVLEDPEPAIKAHVDARGLDHRLVEGFDAHAPGIHFSDEIAV